MARTSWHAYVEQAPKWQPIRSWRLWRDRWNVSFWRRVYLTLLFRPWFVAKSRARRWFELTFLTPAHVLEWGADHTVPVLVQLNYERSAAEIERAHLPICNGTVGYRWNEAAGKYDRIDTRDNLPCRS